MDSFSLLKYWRGGAGGGGGGGSGGGSGGASTVRDSTKKIQHNNNITDSSSSTTTTIVTAVSPSSSDSSDDDNDDDGPFFDLEFALPDDSDNEDQTKDEQSIAAIVEDFSSENDLEETSTLDEEQNHNYKEVVADVLSDDNEIIEGDEIKFKLSSSSSADSVDPNVNLSPSDDLFFKGRLVPVDSSSESDAITKFPVSSILKSATKFRVLMLNFNKSRANVREKSKKSQTVDSSTKEGGQDNKRQQNRFFTVKLKVEEVPIMSLFTRDNSSKGNNTNGGKGSSSSKKCNNEVEVSDSSSVPDDKKFSKDVMHKYLKKVKPLYIRVSKRYSEKLRFSGQLSFPKSGASTSSSSSSPPPPHATEVKSPPQKTTDAKPVSETSEVSEEVTVVNTKSQKQGNLNLHAGLRVVCKHLGKSRSASSVAIAVAPSAPPLTSNRRDDSLLQQQDGIQGAILHCKRSFNASRGNYFFRINYLQTSSIS